MINIKKLTGKIEWLLVIIGAIVFLSAGILLSFANWDSATNMQAKTVSNAFIQTRDNFQALDGTSGTPPAKIMVGHFLEFTGTGAQNNTTILMATTPTADRVIIFPDANSVSFVDRTDHTGPDYILTSFTTDGTWRDFDISTIVPVNAKLVLMHVDVTDDAAGSSWQWRMKGMTTTTNVGRIDTQVANVANSADVVVSVNNAGRILQYKASNLTWTSINIEIRGWWF